MMLDVEKRLRDIPLSLEEWLEQHPCRWYASVVTGLYTCPEVNRETKDRIVRDYQEWLAEKLADDR